MQFLIERLDSGFKLFTMRRTLFSALALCLIASVSSPTSAIAANPELELVTAVPRAITQSTEPFRIIVKLPVSVVLKSTDQLFWNITKYEATNQYGDKSENSNFTNSSQDLPDIRLLEIEDDPFGRQNTYSIKTGLAGNYKLELTASIGKQKYSKTVTLNFLATPELPPIPGLEGISLETDIPNPGNDQISEFRVKINAATEDAQSKTVDFRLVTSSGKLVDPGESGVSVGEWITFRVTAPDYVKQQPRIRVTWYSNSVGTRDEDFYRDFPLEIDFKNTTPTTGYGFKWGYGENPKPVTTITLSESKNPDREIYLSNLADWSKIPANVESIDYVYQLQAKYSSGWEENGGNTINIVNARVGNNGDSAEGTFKIDPECGNPAQYCVGQMQYRIVELGSGKTVATFLVNLIPDKTKLRVTVTVPRQIVFNSIARATVVTSPKINGTCSFFRYSLGDIPLGSAKLKNGVAALNFRAIWGSLGNSTASITARCSGSGRSGSGGTVYYGVR
jgi:hypothetical protein